ncbi:MAG: triphosphoribosyl-dephospho-CoA synthase [Coprococcus sp.]
MYRATGHVNTHKGMIFTLGIFSAAAGRCIQEDGTVTLQSIFRMEQKMTARILRAEIEMLGKEPAKSNGEKNLVQYGTTGIRGGSACWIPICFSYCASGTGGWTFAGNGVEPDQITDPFALMSRVQDSNILSRKNPSVLYQVQMEAMQFLEEGGAYSEDALDKLIRMDVDYIKRGISAGGCADLLATSLFLAMLCNKIPNENGAILNLFPVVK